MKKIINGKIQEMSYNKKGKGFTEAISTVNYESFDGWERSKVVITSSVILFNMSGSITLSNNKSLTIIDSKMTPMNQITFNFKDMNDLVVSETYISFKYKTIPFTIDR